jgi:uncharacterized protein (DUF952 family)
VNIYKIFRQAEWHELNTVGETAGAPIDLADGFIHFSTSAQVKETAAKHFSGIDDLVLAAFNSEQMYDDLVWEKSRGGQDFPHLYRSLRLAEVVWAKPLPWNGHSHVFSDDFDRSPSVRH